MGNADTIGYTILQWDTDFFGFNVYRINLNEEHYKEIDFNKITRPAYIFVSIPNRNIQNLNLFVKHGFKFVSQMVNLEKRYPFIDPEINNYLNFDFAEDRDLLNLQRIGLTAFKYSRFHSDPITNEKASLLHEKWVTNCYNGNLADSTLVYRENGVAVGFLSVKVEDHKSKIVLIGVDPAYGCNGIGGKLLRQFFSYSMNNNVNVCAVRTELNNHKAMNLYIKQGFSITGIDVILSTFME